MTNKFETPQSQAPTQETIHPKVVEQLKDDLRDLFRHSENPVAVLLQEMESDEFKGAVSDAVAEPVKAQLRNLKIDNEDDFVDQVIAIAGPVMEITKKGKKDAYKQEGREMYTEADMEATVAAIEESGAEKIYVVGNVGSGKTTFARELSRAVDYKNIDLDKWFQIFHQEQQREASELKELLEFVLKKETGPFVINHADLLRQDLIQNADLVIYLNPKKEEQLKSRQLRTESGAGGEWQAVSVDDYEKITEDNLEKFEQLSGNEIYFNEQSGTLIKKIEK